MPAKVPLRNDYDASTLRQIAKTCVDPRQVRRLLSLAAVYEGMNRTAAAKLGGMDRQILCDWAHRFNTDGVEGLKNRSGSGPKSRLDAKQMKELAEIVERGPNPEKDTVVRWRRIDIKEMIKTRFGVDYHERHVGTLLHKMGFSHISARPQHPKQDPQVIADFKKLYQSSEGGNQGSGSNHTY